MESRDTSVDMLIGERYAIPALIGYLLTGVECPTGWKGATEEVQCYKAYQVRRLKELKTFISIVITDYDYGEMERW